MNFENRLKINVTDNVTAKVWGFVFWNTVYSSVEGCRPTQPLQIGVIT